MPRLNHIHQSMSTTTNALFLVCNHILKQKSLVQPAKPDDGCQFPVLGRGWGRRSISDAVGFCSGAVCLLH